LRELAGTHTMLYFERGSPTDKLTQDDLRAGIAQALDRV
jgi:hypothetical protein